MQFVDRVHPADVRVPRRWNAAERWVSLEKNPTGRVHVLGWVDEKSYAPGEGLHMGVEHPVSWCRELGERPHLHDDARASPRRPGRSRVFRRHLAGAIAYAAGTRSGDCGATVWSNWKRTVIDEDITDGTQIDVGPDGRVYYLERTASHLKIYDPVEDIVKDAGLDPVGARARAGAARARARPGLLREPVAVHLPPRRGAQRAPVALHARRRTTRSTCCRRRCCCNVPNEGVDHNGGGLAMQSNGDLFLAIGANDMPHFDGQYGSRNPGPLGRCRRRSTPRSRRRTP